MDVRQTKGRRAPYSARSAFSLFGVQPFWLYFLFFSRPVLQVDDACPLAALAALSFDANQLQKAEWHTAYPPVPLALSDRAQRQASALTPPPPPDPDRPAVKTMRKLMDAQAFSAFAAITYAAVGNGRAAMSMIADVARAEIEWQLLLRRPLSVLNAIAVATSLQRRRRGTSLTVSIPAPVRAGRGASVAPAASGQRDLLLPLLPLLGKRRRSIAELAEAAMAPDSPRPKKAKCGGSASGGFLLSAPASASAPASRRPSTPRPRPRPRPRPALAGAEAEAEIEVAPYCALWESLGSRNGPSRCYSDDRDEGRGRASRRKL
ncbi:hypothetical protein DFH94DRAFT_91334 [Russula ochroleuca]|uniref:Uncharacterized protein n=1 Tax=Russula ochroleuca TaxID=152965 RepID=A0A9P5MSK6_9AGAM|nr:hypothetical protein DFH94DRAFT_91334 [Russula ochroleuca]